MGSYLKLIDWFKIRWFSAGFFGLFICHSSCLWFWLMVDMRQNRLLDVAPSMKLRQHTNRNAALPMNKTAKPSITKSALREWRRRVTLLMFKNVPQRMKESAPLTTKSSGLGGMASSFSPSRLGGFHSQQRPNNNFHSHQSNSQSQHRNFIPQQRCKDPNLAGLIVIHGLVMSFGSDKVCKLLFGPLFGLSEQTIIRCPEAERRHIGVMAGLPFPAITRSWFNHFMLPAMSVKSRKLPGENKKELEEALGKIEVVIEQLMNQCVPSENIVVMGFSQGGVLSWYVAMHSKYKLGGFVPIVTWAPLLLVEPPANINPPPVNLNTPILQMNGGADAIVDPSAGAATENVMSKVFPNYKYMLIPGTGHGTTAPNPRTAPIIVKWLKENTNLKFGGGGLGGLTGGLGGLTGGLGGLTGGLGGLFG